MKTLRRRVAKLRKGGWRGIMRTCLHQLRGRRPIKRKGVWYVPLWLPIALALLLASTPFWDDAASFTLRLLPGHHKLELAGFFAPTVRHWSDDIGRWARQADVDANLLATVMQIESCGHPTVLSNAGAQGLFQVMPFHFADGEDMLDPDTNARRGGDYLHYCVDASGGVIGTALACYNGGPSVISQPRENWSSETRAYYRWGVGIYSDAAALSTHSETFQQWLSAGGARLCDSAERELGLDRP